jgi:double-strand break repair protein MRE11
MASSECFNILLATDVHLGYGKGDPLRSHDSLETFEEVLKIAKDNDV